jgi:hypothetical protein
VDVDRAPDAGTRGPNYSMGVTGSTVITDKGRSTGGQVTSRRRRHLAANKLGRLTSRHPPNHSRDPSRSRWGRPRSKSPRSSSLRAERATSRAGAGLEGRAPRPAADRHHWYLCFPPLSLSRARARDRHHCQRETIVGGTPAHEQKMSCCYHGFAWRLVTEFSNNPSRMMVRCLHPCRKSHTGCNVGDGVIDSVVSDQVFGGFPGRRNAVCAIIKRRNDGMFFFLSAPLR